MSYTVLARKYRPQRFSELVGQGHVAQTLGNAIKTGRVAHAFLFTGVRGIGKTTTARLLAKALNCAQGPIDEPCNQCDPCAEITAGNDLDVLEIDGASNNGVDDVRRLQETLPYRPARDRHKVVIVDEVHMLSIGAFNALLKTLEEPPSHVKFIFATTESHKVPLTILSRCQRYDFRLIPRAVIAQHIRQILERESIAADQIAVDMVARQAAGSMRDALTILEQVVASGGDTIGGEQVAQCLGIAQRAQVLDMADALLRGDCQFCVRGVSALADKGLDLLHFCRQLLEYVRDLVVLRVVGDDGELVDLVQEEREAALRVAGAHEPQELERAFAGLSKLVDEVARASMPQLVLEMGLVRLADRPPMRPMGELLAKLESLESQLTGGGGAAAKSGASAKATGSSSGSAKGTGSSSGGSRATGARPARGASASGGSRTAGARPAAGTSEPGRRPAKPASGSAASEDKGGRQSTSAGSARSQARAGADETGAAGDERPATPKTATGKRGAQAAAKPSGDPPEVPQKWQEIVAQLREARPALGAVFEHGVPVEVGPDQLRVAFREDSFFARQATDPASLDAVTATAQQVFGATPRVEVFFVADPESLGSSMAQAHSAQREQEREQRVQRALEHPRVKDALEVFPEGKDNVDVRVDGL